MDTARVDAQGNNFKIVVRSHLDQSWADWFYGMEIVENNDGTTTLTGELIDQAALYGLIKRISDLGLSLLSLNCIDCE